MLSVNAHQRMNNFNQVSQLFTLLKNRSVFSQFKDMFLLTFINININISIVRGG